MGDDERIYRPSFFTIKEAIVAAGWEKPPHWVPDWPDPPPISVWLQKEPVPFSDNARAKIVQPQPGWFDTGGIYSGGLIQLRWDTDQAALGAGSADIVLQTSPVRDNDYFVDVITLATVDTVNGATAGDVVSVWTGHLGTAGQFARYLRWSIRNTTASAYTLRFTIGMLLKVK